MARFSSKLNDSMIVSFLLLIILSSVYGQIDQICVSFAGSLITNQGDTNPANAKVCSDLNLEAPSSSSQSSISSSIGGDRFLPEMFGEKILSIYFKEESASCIQLLGPSSSTINNYLEVAVSPVIVKQGRDQHYLHGWLSFYIQIKENSKEYLQWAFIQVSDENANAIGEFQDPKLCNGWPETEIPFKEQYLPCSTAGVQEPTVSQAFIYSRAKTQNEFGDPKKYNRFPATDGNGVSIRLLWKLNEYYCNRHEKFRLAMFFFVGNVTTSKPVYYRHKWLYPKWFGVADVIISKKGKTISCSSDFPKEDKDKEKFWLSLTAANGNAEGLDELIFEIEANDPPFKIFESCRTYMTRQYGDSDLVKSAKNQPLFGGRCDKIKEKKYKPGLVQPTAPLNALSSVSVPHQCKKNDNATYPEGLVTYQSYLDDRHNVWNGMCDEKYTKCPPLEVNRIRKTLEKRLKLAQLAKGRHAIRPRAHHGWCMCWAFFVLLPTSNLIARYFKETFLSTEVIGFKFWYVLHIMLNIGVLAMIAMGLSSASKGADTYGRSLSGAAQHHGVTGYVAIGFFILSIFLGPLRPVAELPRKIMMITHAVVGYLPYLIGMYLIAQSTVIPGSPSASVCYRNGTEEREISSKAALDHNVTTMVIWGISLEVFFHILLMRFQIMADRTWSVKRSMYFPIMPIVRYEDKRNWKFFRYRIAILIIYLSCAGVFISMLAARLYDKERRDCDMGPMSCTHKSYSWMDTYPEPICGKMAQLKKLRTEF